MKRPLKRLGNKEIIKDIKSYIKTSHEFYSSKVPEIKTLANRLHEEHTLKDFYKVFNKLWKSRESERSLAIHALQLYQEEYDIQTWRFLRSKLRGIKSWDELDSIALIIGLIVVNVPRLEYEIDKLAKNKDIRLRRIAIISTVPLSRRGNTMLLMRLAETYLTDKEERIQTAIGKALQQASFKKPEQVKRFILKHSDMSDSTYAIATENLKEIRKVRKLKKLKNDKTYWFWKPPRDE